MKKLIFLLFSIPLFLKAQPLQFQLEPAAFPISVDGWLMQQPWAGGNDRTTPELCDIDNDGDLDFFTGSEDNYYWLFKNVGNSNLPNFQYISSNYDSLYPFSLTGIFSCIDLCDIDADGDYDAFLCNGSIGLSLNIGNNILCNFAPTDSLFNQYGQLLYGTHVSVVDIDADGDYDLFGGDSYSGHFSYFENIGTPQNYDFNLMTWSWQNVQISGDYADPCFGDLDADGDLDLLVGTGQGNIYYYENQGSPQVPLMVLITNNFFGIDVQTDASPELADIDGDGDLDLFIGRDSQFGQSPTQGDVFFYENVGTPQAYNFQYRTSNYLTWDCGYASLPQLVDIDSDGDIDLLSRIGSKLILYRNQGNSDSVHFVYETSEYGEIYVFDLMPCFCDIDNDGDLDLFAGTGAIPGPPGLKLYLNQGTPLNPNYVLYSANIVPRVFNQTSVILVPGTADIDGDGDLDLFVSDDNGYFYYWENTGTPQNFQFQYQTNNWQDINGIAVHRYFNFYDIDHDGDLDLFYYLCNGPFGLYDNTLCFYRNIGTPQSAQIILENEDMFPELMLWQAAPYVTDIDLDGDGDLFVGDTWGGIRFFRNLEFNAVTHNPFDLAPLTFDLAPAYPNPFNPTTTISFTLNKALPVRLSVYNQLGQQITIIIDNQVIPGNYQFTWDAARFSSGIYLISLESSQEKQTQKVILLK